MLCQRRSQVADDRRISSPVINSRHAPKIGIVVSETLDVPHPLLAVLTCRPLGELFTP
jgi:hypothetical protein